MRFSPAITRLIAEFNKLPGIGAKTAQRLAFHILSQDNDQALALADAIRDARQGVTLCSECCNLTEDDPCDICKSQNRDRSVVCVVENPRDVAVMERVQNYDGLYHVLHGAISPMEEIGPEDIKLRELLQRLQQHQEITEVILAMNPSIEGEATALYIARLLNRAGIKTPQLSHGIPMGADLEYADAETLSRALKNRQEL
ncbi:MAG: recombination protein RecR [Clostridiaceae bacterium]|nr:recombination protein RecR [Clostridiaceae bacterium]